jgi:effector-binding domain-containing protein
MSLKPYIANIQSQPVLHTSAVVPVGEIGATVAADIHRLLNVLKVAGASPKSGPYYRLMQLQEDGRMMIEVGMPVNEPVAVPAEEASRVTADTLPAGFVVMALHHGGLGTVEQARNTVFGAALAKGLQPSAPGWIQLLGGSSASQTDLPTAMIVVPVHNPDQATGPSAIAQLSGALAQVVANAPQVAA